MTDLLPCPFCGHAAHRITPMGHWEPGGYTPNGVRYVCGSLYADPPVSCPGGDTFYGEGADTSARAAWNTRADLHADALAREAALREAVTPSGLWQPPEDREDGYRCLGWTEDGWVCAIWLQMGSDAPRWVTDWYPERDDEPTAFAPLPPALGARQ